MPINYIPPLAQVLAMGNIMDTDIVPDATNTRSFGTLLLRFKDIYSDYFRATDGTKQLVLHCESTGHTTCLGTDDIILYLSSDGITPATARLSLTNTRIRAYRLISPSADNTFDLGENNGTTPLTWRDLYLSGNLKRTIADYSNRELHCHFELDINSLITTLTVLTLYPPDVELRGPGSITQTDATTYTINTDGAIGAEAYIAGFRRNNPTEFTYYETTAKFHISSVDIQGEYLFHAGNFNDKYAWVSLGTNAGTIAFNSTADSEGTVTTTDNITLDVTAEMILRIQIKNGSIRLSHYTGGAWVTLATHTTNIFFDVTEGIYPMLYLESSNLVQKSIIIDYLDVSLGRAW